MTITSPASARPSIRRSVRDVGMGLVPALAGLTAVLIAFTALPWINKGSSKFGEIATRLSEPGRYGNGWAQAYFVWLGWVLIGAGFTVAVLANLPVPKRQWFRIAGVVIAAAAIALTFAAIHLFNTPLVTYGDWIGLARSGFYTSMAGFLGIGIGAAFGVPLRRSGSGTGAPPA